MVLTQQGVIYLYGMDGVNAVSIPLWFLRNAKAIKFLKAAGLGFHTTMVLTQRKTGTSAKSGGKKFPYHYGSYATRGRDGSYQQGSRRFHTTMVLTQHKVNSGSASGSVLVSIPLWFLRNRQKQWRDIIRLAVSIPLWFLRNSVSQRRSAPGSTMFPYHYGSYATAFITKILYRFWGGRINQLGRSRKRHRIYISAIRLDLILDGRSVMWREKAPVFSKEERP